MANTKAPTKQPLARCLILAILLLATGLRLWRLRELPPGLWYDEAYNGMDAAWMLQTREPRLFLIRGTGREVMFHYLSALTLSALGHTTYALRLTMALSSILSIALMYRWLSILFRGHPQRTWLSMIGATGLALSFWHITMSRSGYRASLLTLFTLLTTMLFWKAMTRSDRPQAFIGAGIALGLSQYTYTPARVLPFIFGLFWLSHLLVNEGQSKRIFRLKAWYGLLVMAISAIIVFLPLGIFFLQHPSAFSERANQVFILNRLATGEISLGEHVGNAIGAFTGGSDANWRHGLVGTAGFNALSLFGFWLGVPIAIKRFRHPSNMFLIISLAVLWVPAWVTSDRSVQAWRLAGLFPTYYALSAVGLLAATSWIIHKGKKPTSSLISTTPAMEGKISSIAHSITLALVLIISGGRNATNYFKHWAQTPEVYEAFEGPHVDLIRDLIGQSATHDILIPFYLYDYPTTRYLLHNEFKEIYALPDSDACDGTDLCPKSAQRPAVILRLGEIFQLKNTTVSKSSPYVWLTRDNTGAGFAYTLPPQHTETLLQLDALGQTKPFAARYSEKILATLTPTESIAQVLAQIRQHQQTVKPINYNWNNEFQLLNYQITPTVVRPGEKITLSLRWKRHTPYPVHTNMVVRIINPEGDMFGEFSDRGISDSLYQWRQVSPYPHSHDIPIPLDMPDGPYMLHLALFEADTGKRITLSPPEQDHMVLLGPFYVAQSDIDPLFPDTAFEAHLGEQIKLLGYTSLIHKDALTIKLHWECQATMDVDYTTFIKLLNPQDKALAARDSPPLNGTYPTTRWQVGEIIVDNFNLTLPSDTPPSTYRLVVGMYDLQTMQRLAVSIRNERQPHDMIELFQLPLPE